MQAGNSEVNLLKDLRNVNNYIRVPYDTEQFPGISSHLTFFRCLCRLLERIPHRRLSRFNIANDGMLMGSPIGTTGGNCFNISEPVQPSDVSLRTHISSC